MVSPRWARPAIHALRLISTQPRQLGNPYAEQVEVAAETLQGWYDEPTGLWNTTGWWNAANCLTVLADYAALTDYSKNSSVDFVHIFETTFANAQKTDVTVQKTLSSGGMVSSSYTYRVASLSKRGFSEFLNDFYDDEGWWALGLIAVHDYYSLVSNPRRLDFLSMAEHIFNDMRQGTDDRCGGGIWWTKERTYKNAITNELYLKVAAALARRVSDPSKKEEYLGIAKNTWSWFKQSGIINDNNLINDGLTAHEDGTCSNNGLPTWSYNQGVVLGGLVELALATNDTSYLDEAVPIALAAIGVLKDEDGTIREIDRCEDQEGGCGNDGKQFKGIFMRNLARLHLMSPQAEFEEVIVTNAEAIWNKNRDANNRLGIKWSGPPELQGGPTAATHSSAMDVLVAATYSHLLNN